MSKIIDKEVLSHPLCARMAEEKERGLKLLYDAASCFGVKLKNNSILKNGDLSILSLHAAKVFHTIEGGAIITENDDLAERVQYLRNFGHKEKNEFQGLGINGKLSEVHAAVGHSVLPYVQFCIEKRKQLSNLYNGLLKNSSLKKPVFSENLTQNFAYYPVLFSSEEKLIKAINRLEKNAIFARRYFNPSLNLLPNLPYQSCPVAEDVSRRVLCLPLYHDLKESELQNICELVLAAL